MEATVGLYRSFAHLQAQEKLDLSLRLSRPARLRPIANLVYLQVLSSAQAYRLRQSWQVQHHEVNLGGGSAPRGAHEGPWLYKDWGCGFAADRGVVLTQGIANTLGNFDIQGFRLAAVTWLVENNHPLREFETPAFRRMLAFANPEAEDALWESRTSVSR